MNFEQQILEHMLETNTKLGGINSRLDMGEKTNQTIASKLDCMLWVPDAVKDIEERVQTVEEDHSSMKKTQWTFAGIIMGLGVVSGSLSAWIKNNLP